MLFHTMLGYLASLDRKIQETEMRRKRVIDLHPVIKQTYKIFFFLIDAFLC